MATETRKSVALTTSAYVVPFIIFTGLFFIFGFITNINQGLVPHLKMIFEVQGLRNWEAMLANGAFFTAYFIFSTPASWLIEAIGYKGTIIVSLLIQVVGALLFLPAAQNVSFALFMVAIFIVGAGVSGLQVAVNPYVAALGPEETAPARLNLAQAFNSVGATIAPWVAGTFILTAAVRNPAEVALESPAVQHAYQASIADTVRIPYIVIAIALVVLSIVIGLIHLPHVEAQQSASEAAGIANKSSILGYRHTVLGAVGIFLYVGTEVGLATIMVLYFSDATHGGLNLLTSQNAQKLVAFYWLGALIGRLLGSWLLTRIRAGKLLCIFGVVAALLVVAGILSSGYVAVGCLILAGFFNSIMFPTIFTLGVAGLGSMTGKGSGLIMTAVWGGALIPVAIGWIVDSSTYQLALVVPVICYLFIAWYGISGSKPANPALSS